MKRYLVAGMVAAGALTLAGCDTNNSSGEGDMLPSTIAPHTVRLPDGRTVLCVYEAWGKTGGPSCDWANAK